MFDQISSKIDTPEWWKMDERYWRLERYDRLLDGKFYDHLPYSFYQEMTQSQSPQLIPLEDRRPSSPFNLPGRVSRETSRKLFSGRHKPRIHHPDKEVKRKLRRLAKRSRLYDHMLEIAFRGSVGAVAATFQVYGNDKANPSIVVQVWNAKYCEPSFNEAGDLAKLRVQYIVTAESLKAMGDGIPALEDGQNYWFIKDFTPQYDVIIDPIKDCDWNPVEGFKSDDARTKGFRELDDTRKTHGFDFVPAVWFKNLVGGCYPDGACTWKAAISTSIDMDYTMSQLGRGVRYNAAPQLVTIGQVMNQDIGIVRSPMQHIEMSAGWKTDEGETTGAGDAKLLEMTGQGIEAGLKFVETQRKWALEQIDADRKDPEQMKGPMSGRAMEYLDDGFHDLVMELRGSYGDNGMVPMLKKMAQACEVYSGVNDKSDIEAIRLTWPKLFQPTPTDIAQIMPAFQIALDPFAVSKRQETTGGGGGEGATPPQPVPQKFPGDGEQILTLAEIRGWLRDNMEFGVVDDDDDDDDEIDPDERPPAPGDQIIPPPPPLFDGGGPGEEGDMVPEAGEEGGDPIAQMIAGGAAAVGG